MKITTYIEVEIWNIEIGDKYFSFKYRILVGGEFNTEGEYNDDHVWGDDKDAFRMVLEGGEAVALAIQYINL